MKDQPCSRRLGIFLLLPFAIAGGASLAHFYPYGGTRHIAFLIIPAIAGVSVAFAYLTRQRWDRAVVLGALIVVVCIVFGKQRQPYMERADQDRTHMNAAIDFVRQNMAVRNLIFTDYESDLILGHYLCRQRPISFENSIPDFEEFSCDGVRVISASYKAATLFDATSFLSSWNRLVGTYHLKAGDYGLGFSGRMESRPLGRSAKPFRGVRQPTRRVVRQEHKSLQADCGAPDASNRFTSEQIIFPLGE